MPHPTTAKAQSAAAEASSNCKGNSKGATGKNLIYKTPIWPKCFTSILLWIGCTAFFLRMLVCCDLQDTLTVTAPAVVTDMATYRRLALEILQGQFPPYFDYQPFYYAVFLPLLWLIFPAGTLVPLFFAQSLIGAATVVLTGLCARRLAGPIAGIIAATWLTLSQYHCFYTPFLLLEVLFAFWAILSLWCALKCRPANARWWWFACTGLALSGALLTRGSAQLWIPGVMAITLLPRWRQPKKMLGYAAIMLIAVILPVLPFAIRNSLATGKLCGASVAGGKVLVLGNSPEAPAGGLEYPRTYHQWLADDANGKCSATKHIRQWALDRPGEFLELTFKKLLLFWDSTEIPNNISYPHHGASSDTLQMLRPFSYGLLAVPAFLGMLTWIAQWRRRRWWLPLWMLLATWGGISAFYLLARFRIAALPILTIAAATGIVNIMRWTCCATTANRRQRILIVLCGAAVAVHLVFFATPMYTSSIEPWLYRQLRPQGTYLAFPNEAVIYDHGAALGFGGTQSLTPPNDQPLVVTKEFAIPHALRQKYGNSPVKQQLLVRIILPPQQQVEAHRHNLQISLEGRRIPTRPTLDSQRSALWVVAEFTAPLPQKETIAFQITLPPGGECALAVDESRSYGRTTITLPPYPPQPQPFELTAEWVVPTAK